MLEFKTNPKLVEKQKQWIRDRVSDLENAGVQLREEEPRFQLKYVSIGKLHTTETIDSISTDSVFYLLKEGKPFPPIAVDKKFNIHDGHHRYYSALNLGIKKVPVLIWLNPVIPGWAGWKRKEASTMAKIVAPQKIKVAGILYEKIPEKIRVNGKVYVIAASLDMNDIGKLIKKGLKPPSKCPHCGKVFSKEKGEYSSRPYKISSGKYKGKWAWQCGNCGGGTLAQK